MTLIPELKDWFCSDVDDIERWVPEHQDVFYWLNLSIGQRGDERSDDFGVLVATPDGLKRYRQSSHPEARSALPPIVVHPYSWDTVAFEIRRRLERCEGSDWPDMVRSLQKVFQWEYEGIK